MDRSTRCPDGWRIQADDLGDFQRDFNGGIAFPKPKIHESCVRRVCVRSRADRNRTFIAEFPADLTQNDPPTKSQQLLLFCIQISSPMIVNIHRESLAIVEQAVAESADQQQVNSSRTGRDQSGNDSLQSVCFLTVGLHY